MNKVEYDRMAELEDTYWWHVGRKSIIWFQLKRLGLPPDASILNIGCGTGGMIPIIQQYGSVENVDVSDEAADYVRQRGLGEVHRVDGVHLPFGDGHFDVVVATDVLEHIEDDAAALREWKRVLKRGGQLILTVPAYQWLWSVHDERLHHFRRYTASEVHRKLNAAGYVVKKRTYMIVLSFPLVVGFRIVSGLSSRGAGSTGSSYVRLPRPVNRLFTDFLRLEARAIGFINFPFGTSVLAVAQNVDGVPPQA